MYNKFDNAGNNSYRVIKHIVNQLKSAHLKVQRAYNADGMG